MRDRRRLEYGPQQYINLTDPYCRFNLNNSLVRQTRIGSLEDCRWRARSGRRDMSWVAGAKVLMLLIVEAMLRYGSASGLL